MNTRVNMIFVWASLLLMFSASAQSQIYKQVDKNGNVTYTDQVPPDGSKPMVLPELSIIHLDSETEIPSDSGEEVAVEPATPSEPTPRDLRRMYRDFRITRPVQEESLWGAENMVVISWGSSTALRDDMQVNVFVDGQPKPTTGDNMLALTLDRGEHQVYAELLDARGRRIVTTDAVTFFIKQNSAQFNRNSPVSDKGP